MSPVVLSSGLAGINAAVNRFHYMYIDGKSTVSIALNHSAVSGGRVYVNVSGVDNRGFIVGAEVGYVSKMWVDLGSETQYYRLYLNGREIIKSADINTETSVMTITLNEALYLRFFCIEIT